MATGPSVPETEKSTGLDSLILNKDFIIFLCCNGMKVLK